MKLFFLATSVFLVTAASTTAQQENTNQKSSETVTNNIPISNADLGTFPYFKTLPNFYAYSASDSVTIEQNRTYFSDGKNYFIVDGKVSSQKLYLQNAELKKPSEFQIIQDFDKIISSLGGKKIYQGRFPDEALKKMSDYDVEALTRKYQIANSSYYGVIEYVIKTPKKEVWVQLVASTINTDFYTLFVVEKQNHLIGTNINKENLILKDMERNGKAITNLYFELDSAALTTQSKDELLNMVGVFQAHANWKMKIEIHNAPIGKPDYVLSLTEKRSAAIKNELISLGVKDTSLEAKGLGDTKPLVSNDTEKGRNTNTRVEISKL